VGIAVGWDTYGVLEDYLRLLLLGGIGMREALSVGDAYCK
jgi:hypothetical protein